MNTTTTCPAPLSGLEWHAQRMAEMRSRADAAPKTWTAEQSAAAEAQHTADQEARRAELQAELGAAGSCILISCSSTKLDHAAPAKDLYTSPLFRKARELAERSGRPWMILSAKHGLLDPEQIVEPYDLALSDLRAEQRHQWAGMVRRQLSARWEGLATFEIYAGKLYLAAVEGLEYTEPLAGLQVGERLRTLNLLLSCSEPAELEELTEEPAPRQNPRYNALVSAIPTLIAFEAKVAGWYVLRDNLPQAGPFPTDFDAARWLHGRSCSSIDWACRHEGWEIVPMAPEEGGQA